MTKAFAYIRVSGKSQVDGDGFPRQTKAIKDYASKHGLKIIRTFREEGVSGAMGSMDRPAWCDLITALHGDRVKTIIIERLDRLARDLMVQESIICDLRKNGLDLISVIEPDLMGQRRYKEVDASTSGRGRRVREVHAGFETPRSEAAET